ncbi:MAG: hypothetical protein H6733_10700 [Alphaproteobacteria bacterium]|nr:hypothetical protein [Alphaproteobacteria bacterium]
MRHHPSTRRPGTVDGSAASATDIAACQPQNHFAVLRVWLDTDCRRDLRLRANFRAPPRLGSITTALSHLAR